MKILTTIFTYPPNEKYFLKCIEYFEKSCQCADERIDLLIIDFGETENEEGMGSLDCMYLWKPMAGFGSNFNSAMSVALTRGYDYLLNINDDSLLDKFFIKEGLSFLEANPNVGLAAGIPNQDGWGLELEDIEIPALVHTVRDIEPLDRLWWECSAALYRVEALHKTGLWDETFDLNLGGCGDNDYYHRMKKTGYDLYRLGTMRFFHFKGITQMAFGRRPFDRTLDTHKQKNLEYFYQKWNIRLEQDKTFGHAYQEPFNGKKSC
jgi:hypothetical protein